MLKKSNMNTDFVRGYKVKIYPTESQKQDINRNIQLARAVYNRALDIQISTYEANGKTGYLTYYDLEKMFSTFRNSDPSYSWLKDISIGVIRRTLNNLDTAFKKFFSGQTRFPKFKSRKRSKKSFSIRAERCHIYGKYIQISGLKDGKVYAKNHHIPEGKKLYNTVVSFDGYDYWFSCTVESDPIDMGDIPISNPIGIDVGIVNMITTSDGDFYKYDDDSKLIKRLKRQQIRLDKDYKKYLNISISTTTKYEDVPKSKNHYKKLYKQHKTYSKIKNKIHTAIHTATKRIVDKNPSAIVIETLSANEHLQRNYLKAYKSKILYYEIHNQIEYKAHDRGIPVIKADKNFPSSKLCSRCGNRGYFRKRSFICPHCGYHEDRDLNAAYNLKKLAYQVPNENSIVLSIDA